MSWLQQSNIESHFMRFPGIFCLFDFFDEVINLYFLFNLIFLFQNGQLPLVNILTLYHHKIHIF